MVEKEFLAERFEADRGHLRGVAYRMLGSLSEADDAVQEAWFRLNRTDSREVTNLTGWLTTVVARVCLDMLRSRRSRREEPWGATGLEPGLAVGEGTDPEQEALLADSVGLALLVVLETLTPAERLAFVLHDMFAVPFEEIAPIVGRTPTSARQLASRARRRVHGASPVHDDDLARQKIVVEAYLAASRTGNFEALLAVLDPDVVIRADEFAVRVGAAGALRGAEAVAGQAMARRASFARLALVDGAPGAVVAPRGKLLVALEFAVIDGRITEIEVIADPARLRTLDLAVIGA